MTDYTKLIESLRILGYFANDMQARSVAKEAADAIQAMQAENASLKQIAELNAQIAIDLKAERDQLQAENERLKSIPMKYKRMEFNAQLQEENAVLQAKLDELSKQKPVGVVALYPDVVDWTGEEPPIGANLYAAPKALEPSREVIERYMADKGFYLSKEAMDGLMAKLGESGCTPKALAPTVLKPFTPCVCHDDTAKRYCKDKGKCSYFEAHGIGGTP